MGFPSTPNAPVNPVLRQNFLNLCGQANTTVDLAERRFSAWLSSVAIAYSDAWQTHTKFLKDIGTKTKLTEDILVGAALALIPGVAGGVLGDAMKIGKDIRKDTWSAALFRSKMPIVADVMIDLSAGSPTIDGLKDLAKWGMRSGAIVGQPSLTVPMGAVFNKFPTDPLSWQNGVNQRVQQELANVTATIAGWQDKVNKGDPNFDINFNPVDAVKNALALTSKNLSQTNPAQAMNESILSLQPVDKTTVSEIFQGGFLAKWIVECGFRAYAENSQLSWGGLFGDGVQGDIVKYGESLGLINVKDFLSNNVNRGVQENNQKAIQSGHGLI